MNIDDALAEELQLQEAILFSAFQEMIIQDTDDDDSIGNLILIGQDQGQESKKPFSVADHGESSSPSPLTMTTTTGGGGAGEFYCSICMETVPGALKFSVSPCLHAFCVCCIGQYVAAKIGENTADVRCPDPGCGGGVEPESCRGVVPSEVLDRWGLLLCEAAIVARRLHCPFRDCSEPLLADADGEGGGVAEAECPSCHRLFCARCMVPWHDGVGCEEFQELGEDERGREDVMVRRLAGRERWQRCPQCRMYVEKSEGCMFMKCRAAGEGPPDMSANVDLDAKRLVPLKAWGRCRGCWSSSSSYPRNEFVKTNTDYIEKGEYSGGDRPVRSRVGKMAPTGMKFDLVKFDGSGNFGLWQTKVKDLLAQQGVSKALKGEKPAKMEDDDWKEMQLQAAATIRLCLSDQEGADLTAHVNVFNQLVTDFMKMDVEVDDEDKAIVLLCSLPESYEHVVTTLTYGKKTIKTKDITSALLARDQMRKNKEGETSQAEGLLVKEDHVGHKLGDDTSYPAVGVREVNIKLEDGGEHVLQGVRHVPGLKRNLISLETLHEEGLIFRGNRNRKTMEIMKDKTTVMTGEKVESHLYKLRGCTVAGGVQEGAVARIAIVFGGGGSGAYSSGGLR
nr:putative protein-binding protein [Oryza sativa Japonica Group]